MDLSNLFLSVAIKKLARVDLPDQGSNQHEINGVRAFREFFGSEHSTEADIRWSYFAENEEVLTASSRVKFYDAREAIEGRTEWRLYYSGNFLEIAEPGDLLILVKEAESNEIRGLILQSETVWVKSFSRLLGIDLERIGDDVISVSQAELKPQEVTFIEKTILVELGFEGVVNIFPEGDLDKLIKRFGPDFVSLPSTREMSSFAREQIEFDPSDPDTSLLNWIEQETTFFNAGQFYLIQQRINTGFDKVEDFLSYSNTVMNTRKSRMGHVLENHLEAIFVHNKIHFSRSKVTEENSRPDFVFPGISYYHDPQFEAKYLKLLGAKSTLRERWRDVVGEGERIEKKHLCTLDPNISRKQIKDIYAHNLTLVLPERVRALYEQSKETPHLNIKEFVEIVVKNQGEISHIL